MKNGRHNGSLPPGPRQPAASQATKWLFRPIPFMERCRERFGPVFTIQLGAAGDIVVVGDPKGARQVLEGHPEVFNSGAANQLFRPVVGRNSLLLLDGAEHMRHRKILLPSFRAGHVQQFGELIEDITRRRIAAWPLGEPLKLAPEMEAITFETMMRIAFGTEKDPRERRLGELIPEMMDRADSPFTLIPSLRKQMFGASPFARLMKVVGEIDNILYELIVERAADPLVAHRDDVLSVMLRATHEDGSPLDEHEIRDEVLTLLMAGYETTTSALTWAFERILRTPEVHSRVCEEIGHGQEDYLEAVVKESLRLRPVVPIVARKVAAPVEIAGYTVPKGTVLMASVYLLHTDPGAFPEPHEFMPERFLGEHRNPTAWVPFGGGVRRCLGAAFAQLEMKIVLRTVLGSLNLRAPAEEPEPAVRRRFTFVPKHGGLVVADSRSRRRPALKLDAERIEGRPAGDPSQFEA